MLLTIYLIMQCKYAAHCQDKDYYYYDNEYDYD